MSHRSVIETLDLHNDYGEYHRDACGGEACGWLSPKHSFSVDFLSGSSERFSPDKKQKSDGEDSPNSYATEFEFSMAALDAAGSGTPGFLVPADELFHKGKLLPGFLPPIATQDDDDVLEPDTPHAESPLASATTISRHLNAEISDPSSLGCVVGASCLRAPKGPKWRELFGALRRVKSDSGRQRIPDESLIPPKAFQGKKKFFKQIFGTGNDGQEPNSIKPSAQEPNTKSSSGNMGQARTCYYSAATAPSVPSSASHAKNQSWDSGSSRYSSRGVAGSSSASASAAAENRSKAPPVNPPQPNSSEIRPDYRAKSSSQSSDGFTFNPTPGKARPSNGNSTSSSGAGGRVVSPIKTPVRGANFGRSPSGRVIVRGLDKVASRRSSASLQEQVRALRSREIRRSPDRSGYSNVRVTPVLNVPVCMGPVLRGATKAGKGRLSNFRSFLTFKSKLPTSMFTTPIATR